MLKPLVSIIIPTYNRAHIIGETLDSVLVQTYPNWECIVVDDGSTDETCVLLGEYLNKDIRFKYLVKPADIKKGASSSRNLGLKIAKGEYIQFLDSDDILAKNKIEMQLELLEKESHFTLSTCKWGKFNSISDELDFLKNKSDYKTYENGKEYFDLIGVHGGFYPSHCFLIPKSLISKVGFWNESLTINDDGEFFFRILSNAHKIVFSDKTYVLYRNNSLDNLSLLNSESKAISLLNSWKIIESLYVDKYNEVDSTYINKKKNSVYNELKRQYPRIVKQNKDFFKFQIKNDTFFFKLTKLKKRIKNKMKLILRF
jgi:glycosyltransferase involved in cell wall biosynthesis